MPQLPRSGLLDRFAVFVLARNRLPINAQAGSFLC
jgi:hypothetical protein